MDETDREVLKQVLDALVEEVSRLHHPDGVSLEDLIQLQAILSEANFYVSGIIYSNGEVCTHDHDH